MRKIFALLLILIVTCTMVACSGENEDATSSDEIMQQETQSNIPTSGSQEDNEVVEQVEPEIPPVEITMVDLFIDEYNKAAATPITDISEIDVTNKESGHYRTEFRLGAFADAYAKMGLIGDIVVDIVGYGWDKEDIRIYADEISLEQTKEIIKISSPILDETLSDSDIQDVMSYLDENQEENGYYYGDIGLLLLEKHKESYELMLKVE